ncbi:MAG: SDR family NAD(P)-dependent oxidoreductase [Actinomycetota bacterium]
MNLNGASALVLGASGGLGTPITRLLVDGGAVVTAVGRDPERLGALPDAVRRFPADMRSPHAAGEAVAAAIDHGGGLDIVINAVGVVAFGEVGDLDVDTMEELFLTNSFVPIMVAGAALPVVREGGAIVNISGVIAEQNLPGMATYGASKAAVRSFDEALAREARRRRVRVIDARPPHTETGLAQRAIAGTAPKMPPGLAPDVVAERIVDALRNDESDLPSGAFA